MKFWFSLLLLIFQSVSIFSAEIAVLTLAVGKEYNNAVQAGIENKRAYCQKHGYDFICCENSLDTSRPIPWSKILLVQQVLKNNPSYKWVFWTDADSLIMNQAISIEDLIDDQYNLIISKDTSNVFNSGQFLIKNCQWSDDFLSTVYARTEFIKHQWWENMAIIEELKIPKWLKLTKEIPQRLINSYQVNYRSGDFILHFASVRDLNNLRSLMESFSQEVITSDDTLFTLDYYLGIYGMKLSSLHSFVNEGYMTDAQKAQFNKYLGSYDNVTKILEIGFNAGHSCYNFFLNCKKLKKLVALDISTHPYTKVGVEFMTRKYKERFKFIKGDSLVTVPAYSLTTKEKFDLIYVDASHTFYNCFNDIVNAKALAHAKTILWVDDFVDEVEMAVSECVEKGIIAIDFVEHSEDPIGYGRIWVQAHYLFN